MELYDALLAYRPFNEQEEQDREMMLRCLKEEKKIWTRENPLVHMTASGWIVNPARDRVVMAYHNVYRSWAWLGGHADGETDLLQVAVREALEESGLANVRPVTEAIFSIEALTVDGHVKRGRYVSSHIHLNVTYLLEADESEQLCIKPDENSGVRWFQLDEAVRASSEAWMRENIYEKLNKKLRTL